MLTLGTATRDCVGVARDVRVTEGPTKGESSRGVTDNSAPDVVCGVDGGPLSYSLIFNVPAETSICGFCFKRSG